MTPTIYQYEVEAQAFDKRLNKIVLISRTEHAYTLMDAMHQAFIHIAADDENLELRKVVRIGPSAELIRLATAEVGWQIAAAMEKITEGTK